jgi:hypothetical protein
LQRSCYSLIVSHTFLSFKELGQYINGKSLKYSKIQRERNLGRI